MNIKKRLLVSMMVLGVVLPLVLPYVALAAHAPVKSNIFDPRTLAGPLLLCTGSTNTGAIGSTCQNLCDLLAQIVQIIYYLMTVILWVIAPILITWGGMMILLAGASPELVGRGKKTITSVVWGIVIMLLAWVIVFTFVNAFGTLNGLVGGFPGIVAAK